MIIIPKEKTIEGLIYSFNPKRSVYASSSNLFQGRENNPINYSSSDRWCSAPSINEEWWKVKFDHYSIYITNYSISNSVNVPVHSWYLDGGRRGEWTVISEVRNSDIGVFDFGTWNVSDPGPFSSFRLRSIENALDDLSGHHHFCLYKVDFFGALIVNSSHKFTCLSFGTSFSHMIFFLVFIPQFLIYHREK